MHVLIPLSTVLLGLATFASGSRKHDKTPSVKMEFFHTKDCNYWNKIQKPRYAHVKNDQCQNLGTRRPRVIREAKGVLMGLPSDGSLDNCNIYFYKYANCKGEVVHTFKPDGHGWGKDKKKCQMIHKPGASSVKVADCQEAKQPPIEEYGPDYHHEKPKEPVEGETRGHGDGKKPPVEEDGPDDEPKDTEDPKEDDDRGKDEDGKSIVEEFVPGPHMIGDPDGE